VFCDRDGVWGVRQRGVGKLKYGQEKMRRNRGQVCRPGLVLETIKIPENENEILLCIS
jgi:hypothetical protein